MSRPGQIDTADPAVSTRDDPGITAAPIIEADADRWRVVALRLAVVAAIVTFVAAAGYEMLAPPRDAAPLVAGVVQLSGLAALLARRRTPALVLAGQLAVFAATRALLGSDQAIYPLLLALVAAAAYTVATVNSPKVSILLSVGALLALVATATGVAGPVDLPGPKVIQYVLLLAAATAAGMNVQARRALLASYRERAAQAEREQRLIAAQAVNDERQRVARDLHDIVAHHVSLLVVQAGAVRESVPVTHPSRGLLDSMISGGRQAMDELRVMLSALRIDTGPTTRLPESLHPGPGLKEIADLVTGVRNAGLCAELCVSGPKPAAVDDLVSVTSYRIVQEALTNVAKHAVGQPATITLHYARHSLSVRVTNPINDSTLLTVVGGGHGVIGMRERARSVGGTLTAGRIPAGYEVAALLPYTPKVRVAS